MSAPSMAKALLAAACLCVAAWALPAGAQPVNGAGEETPETGAPASEEPLGEDEAMVLNFERADVREVIHSLATALGLSYTIDPNITGEITIRTTGRIPRRELFSLFNQILRANGIAAVKQGSLYHIVPVAEAKGRAIVPRRAAARAGAREDNFVIEILAMRHVAAEEMANILTPFLTPGGEIFSYPRANTVVVVDLRSNVERLRELATTFDVDGFSNLRARVYKLKEGDPEELTNEILTLLGPYGAGPEGGGLFMIPLYRLNSIVAFAYDPAAFAEIERWLALLDIPPEKGSGRQTFVYNVENAKAADLAAVLSELFGEGGPAGAAAGTRRAPGAAPAGVGLFGAGGVSGTTGGAGRTGGGTGATSLSRSGGTGARSAAITAGAQGNQQGRGLTAGGGIGGTGAAAGGRRGAGGAGGLAGAAGTQGQAGAAGGVLGVVLPGGTQAVGAPGGALGAQGQLGAPTGPPPIFKQEVRIVADEVTNSLVVLATKRDYQLILDVLRRLDIVPRQVVLEVMIAEVVLGKGLEFGVSYAYTSGNLANVLPPDAGGGDDDDGDDDGGSGVGAADPTGLFQVFDRATGLVGSAERVPGAGAFAIINRGNDFQIFLNALQARTNVKMLAAPHVIAADNREAYILVGQSIPILTSTSTVLGTGANVTNAVQYRDTGKILSVLPQVNSKGLVNLQIRQEVSAVLETAEGTQASFGATNSPAFSTREVETTLVVQNGATVLIGGIIDDQITHSRSGVPYLMDVPVLGWAFRSERNINNRTELLITITPFVIRNREEAESVTEDFSSRIEGLRQLQDAMRARHRPPAAELEEEDLFEGVPVDERR